MGLASDELVVPKNEGDFIYDIELKSYVNKVFGKYCGTSNNNK